MVAASCGAAAVISALRTFQLGVPRRLPESLVKKRAFDGIPPARKPLRAHNTVVISHLVAERSRTVGAIRTLISAIPVGVHHPGDAQTWRTSPPVESLWYVVEPVRFSSLARLFLFFPMLGQSEVAVWSNVREPRKYVELRGFEPLTPSMRTP